jgi:quercetin dioxygenase-like cupin family protein
MSFDDEHDSTALDAIDEVEARPGIFRKVYTRGSLQMIVYRYTPGSVFESHSHPEEQLSLGMKGDLMFTIGRKRVEFGPGSIAHIPGGVPHSAINIGSEEAVTVNVYTPPKEGLMDE